MSAAIFKTSAELEYLARTKYIATKKWSDPENFLETNVKIRIIDLRWFMRKDRPFFAFSELLENFPLDVYDTEFIVCLIEEFFSGA